MISGKPTQPCLHDGSSRKEVISIADKKFRGRDKIVQKMTKDGLVDENLRTGEQKSATAEEKSKPEDSAKPDAHFRVQLCHGALPLRAAAAGFYGGVRFLIQPPAPAYQW